MRVYIFLTQQFLGALILNPKYTEVNTNKTVKDCIASMYYAVYRVLFSFLRDS